MDNLIDTTTRIIQEGDYYTSMQHRGDRFTLSDFEPSRTAGSLQLTSVPDTWSIP